MTYCVPQVFLLFLISQVLSYYIQAMGDDEQIIITTVKISLDYFQNIDSCLAQGIWTRYNPLSQIPQIGDFGLFDSNLYNIHNVVDELTGFSNFLYYDFVDNESKTIKKFIQFIDEEENQYNFQFDLDPLNYENTWFYFGISIFPQRKKVQLIILQNQNQIFFQNLDIMFPYYDKNLKVTFGGGLALTQSQRIQIYQDGLILSYFPGRLIFYNTSIQDIKYYEYTTHMNIDQSFDSIKLFFCMDSQLEIFSYDPIKFLNIVKRLTENNFLYSYQFSGWIKAIEIHQTDEEFLYKLIKISTNSENNLLTNDNLSPFQLLYRFEGEKQYLQILTYSYTFPSVTLDFSQNPFLIKKEVLLTKEISLWHYLFVQFEENQIKIDFTFYDIVDQFNLNFLIDVNHFHYMKFKIQFGNLFENSLNYINFRLLQFSFAPCLFTKSNLGCDSSCQYCDGPTQFDCLSCNPDSKRIYLPESKSCVCPENMVDQKNNCITYENSIKPFTRLLKQGLNCQFGYFLLDDDTCVKCPSNPNMNTLLCLECIQNPYTWKSQATCKQSLFYNQSDNLIYKINYEENQIPIYTFDGTNLQLCQNCEQQNLSNIADIYENYKQSLNVLVNIVKQNINNLIQYCQKLQFCIRCFVQNDDLICSMCETGYYIQNNICQKHNTQRFCVQPYYQNSRRQCSLCQIEYCQYCFEYLQNDLSKSTQYKDFEVFEIDEFHSIGCALCNEGFQFNFQQGKCLFQQSQIQNCIRSFINLDGQEICTLSNLQTFDLSPEINNCQNKILNCKQCIRTPTQIIKCIVCDDGYSASIKSGKCQICPIQNSKTCIQGYVFERNAWVQLIQSFIMQFLNKKYFYPKGQENFIYDYVMICQNGFRPTSQNQCQPNCNSECLRCAETDNTLGFRCLECPLNKYNQIQRSSDNKACIKCPKLCSLCQIRSTEEIKTLNPYFIVTDENVQYTYKCIQSAFKDNTIIDSKFQIAKQVFGNETYILNFNFEIYCDIIISFQFFDDINVGDNKSLQDYQSIINFDYCNQQGIENIQITIQYKRAQGNFCSHQFEPQIFDNSLRQKIFSLNFISFVFGGNNTENNQNNLFMNPIQVLNFDSIKLEFIYFYLIPEMYIKFANQNFLSIQFQNLIFSSGLTPVDFKILNTRNKHVEFINLTFQEANFTNTIIFNITGEYLDNQIFIKNLKLTNCYFLNSILISIFSTTQEILIENLTIENSIFVNSSILVFDAYISFNINGKFQFFDLINNQFFKSICFQIQKFHEFQIRDISISESYLLQSNLFSVMAFKIDLSQLNIYNNILLSSSILISINEQQEIESYFEISNLNCNNNKFTDSFLLKITPKYNQQHQNIQINLNNFFIEKNYAQDNMIQSFLFYIHCNTILVENIKIIDQYNISLLYIQETEQIQIQQLSHENSQQNKIIPLRNNFQNNFNSLQILKVYGFIHLKLENIKITNLNTLDPFFELLSNIFWNTQQIEKVLIQNINFTENILLKQNLGKRLSLILIFSENSQNIIFKEINFSNNLLHQTVDDSSDTVAGLIYIKSPQSKSEIFDFMSINNWITNSSSSFFYAEIDFLSIDKYQCENLNVFNYNFIQNYISIPFNHQLFSQEEFQLIVQNILSIKTKGCACFATVRKFQIINGQFKKIFSKTSPLFEIQTQSLGLIILSNLLISQIDVIYESNIDLQGCIYIYSSSSNLDLNLSNIQFVEVFSKFSPSIISIVPSQSKNKLVFQNIFFQNCISLKNQILKIEFPQENAEQNNILFQNISLIQTEQVWVKYFKKIGQISSVDLEKIMNDNAVINLINCKLTLSSVAIEGIFVSPIIRIVDSMDLKIINSYFIKIKTFYFFNLIQIEQNKYQSVKIQILKCSFQNIQLIQPNIDYFIENEYIIYQDQFFNTDFIFSKTNQTFISIISLFQTQQSQNQGSLFYIQSLSNQTKISISQLNLIENYCNFCNQGLVFLDITQIKKLYMTQFICAKNKIKQFGCLYIKSNKIYKNQFYIRNSIFGLNQGQQGTGIFISGLKGIMKSSQIFNNSAVINAGGIMIHNGNNDFFFNNTLIFQNIGYLGGGLVLDSTSNINTRNFIQSFLEFNSANYLANNLIEAPTQLNLQINAQRMRSYQQIYDNITEYTLKLENQKLYQQDSLINQRYLLIPSNQKISEYKIFDQKIQVFKQYIYDLSLYFTNSYQEKLGDLDNQNCSVYQNILLVNGSLVSQIEEFVLYFNPKSNTINLGDLKFTFDPYEQKNLIQQIEIFCKINDYRALSYKINTKTFFCQFGEFYSQGGCQICEANYGFYSVTFNATKCSIFDKTKFKAITSNTISLLPGFWRPNYLSDFPEYCFKDTKFCLGEWNVGDQSCLNGHIGGLCEECDFYNIRGDGYFFKNSDNNDCLLCNENKSSIILFIFAFFLAIFSILITLNSISTTNKLFASLKLIEKFGKIIYKLNQDHSSFLLKMFFNYLWIFSIIFTYNIPFSINLNVIDQASNTSYFMANNLDCFLQSIQYANLIYIRIIGTIVFIFIQIILINLYFLILSKFQKSQFDYSNISNTCLYLYISNHASITEQFCLLIAKRVISNISYVQGNVSLQFYSQNHQNWLYYFVFPGLTINGCIIPLLLIAILYTKRKQLDQIRVRKHICYLFNEYNDKSYCWEQIKIWQKTIIILIITYFEDDILLKTTLLGLGLMLYQFLAIMQKPFIIQNLNKLDIESGQICTIAIFLAAVRSGSNSSNQALIIIQIIIIVLCLLLVYQFISVIFKVYVQKYKMRALKFIWIFFEVISSKSNQCEYFHNLYSKEKQKKEQLQKNYDKLRQYLNRLSQQSKLKQSFSKLVKVEQVKKYENKDYDSIKNLQQSQNFQIFETLKQ